MKIEAENAREEVKELLERCVNCGLCKSLCPIFRIIKEETVSPRGRTILLNKDIYEELLYDCTLCKACELKCPLELELCDAFRKARQVLVGKEKETKENKEMIKNIRRFGNPFGKPGEKIRKLYCC